MNAPFAPWKWDGENWIFGANGAPLLFLDFHAGDKNKIVGPLAAAAPDLVDALASAIRVAEEARREWDAAPDGMKAGKLLIALSGHCPGYRADIDAIHAALSRARGETEGG